ncbi:MAG: serine/threonine-protein kinase [Telluria sp.]
MAAQNNAPLPDGLELAGYRIVKKIASGGFSIVYLAYDSDGKAVAIKEYLPSSLALRQPGELAPVIQKANLPVFHLGLKCFFEEGRALAMIVHPNVVRVLNFFRAHETVYMVMAYESGRSLQEHVARQFAKGLRMTEPILRHVFLGVCNGLREVHANKLLHLDLKPANIYLRRDGTPMLLDFGAARQGLNKEVPKLRPMYTPGFAPPDLYGRSVTLGPWSDIYSLGAAMYACMAGTPPQPADQRLKEDLLPAQLDALRVHYSDELLHLVGWCMELDPDKRPASLFMLQKALPREPARIHDKAEPEAGALQRAARVLAERIGFGRRKTG